MEVSRGRAAIIVRFGLLALCLLVMWVQESLLPVPEARFGPATIALVAAGLTYAAYFLPVARRLRPEVQSTSLNVVDTLFVTVVVYLTGGVNSAFVYLYFALIFAAGMNLRPRSSLIAAVICSALLAAVWGSYALARETGGRLPFVLDAWSRLHDEGPGFFGGYLFAQIAAFHLVGFLSSLLAGRIFRVRILNREILQASPSGILALGTTGRIAFVNRPARELLGIQYDQEVVGLRAERILTEPSTRRVLAPLLSLTEMHFETELPGFRFEPIPVEVTTRVLFDPNKRCRGAIAILEDLSLSRRMEEAIQRAERLEALGRMAAGIAHEIRNPLAGIRSAAQALGGLAGLEETDQRLLGLVVEESDRLNRIVTEFLHFARIRQPDLESVDVARLIEDVVLLVRAAEDDRPIEIETNGSLECRADPEQLKQVVLNLCRNALEASPPGRPVVIRAHPQALLQSIRYDARDGHEMRDEIWGVRLDFIDTGRGIAPADRPRLFEPFFTTKEGGSGLGLAISHRIIEAHRGTIEVLAEDGQTIFRVWLPRVPEFLSPGGAAS